MISVEALSFIYPRYAGESKALVDISFHIKDGEYVALMGPNGCGKTSLSRCLNGILQPTTGEVIVDGLSTKSADELPEIRKRIGMVFQNPDNQIFLPTVEREIAFGLENIALPREEMHRRVEAMLDKFQLKKYRHHSPIQLSGGEKQRLATASIVAMQPSHFIFDEPTSLLDYTSRVRLFKTIRELRSTDHKPPTILLITQFPEEALFAQRLLIMNKGEVIMDGAPTDLFQKEGELGKIGLHPPVEFQAYNYFKKNSDLLISVEDFMLSPIL